MIRALLSLAIGTCVAVAGAHGQTAKTGATGGNQPVDNYQPSLAVTLAMPLGGMFPSQFGGSAGGGMLGFVYAFAGSFAPGTSLEAQGQLMPISENTAVFSLLGTTYGGNGQTTYALPNLAGSAIVGTGIGPGLSTQDLGVATGSATVFLSTAQIASHGHTLSGGGLTGAAGGNQPFNNLQPSLPLRRVIAIEGIYPSPGGGGNSAAFLGQVATFAGNFAPGGWAFAEGQLLSIAENEALFSILGTTYGGDGESTFALPDLRGRVSVGVGVNLPLGSAFGQESTALATSQLAAHLHTLPGGGVTGATGDSQAFDKRQPSLALHYLIALNGIFPSIDIGNGFDTDFPILGQIVEFAGNFAPGGWALANGQLLPIAQNQALFAILGTQYGGNGQTTFALPDLRGRTLIGSGGDFPVGTAHGSAYSTLTVANLPAHDHTLGVAPGAARISHDLSGDGKSDILWRNASTGENYLYPMDGKVILGTEGYIRTVADQSWQVAGVGDFDGDGKADILWRNSATGGNYIYFMNGTTILPGEGYLRTVADQNWQVAGVGDFNGDGKDDILWRNSSTGETYLYPMNGLAILGTEGYLRTAPLAWGIVGVGDFDGDGKADILWRNSSSGENYLYPMNGTTILGTEGYLRTVTNLNWQVKGTGDFDGDGKADIFWRNATTGENYVYPMNGTTILGTEGYLRTVANLDWQVKGTGDYDGDGKADILWRNALSGENYLYPMDGTTIKPSEGYLRTVPQPDWRIQ